jgi:hypothetical protein
MSCTGEGQARAETRFEAGTYRPGQVKPTLAIVLSCVDEKIEFSIREILLRSS